jgi:hypothetical protein
MAMWLVALFGACAAPPGKPCRRCADVSRPRAPVPLGVRPAIKAACTDVVTAGAILPGG